MLSINPLLACMSIEYTIGIQYLVFIQQYNGENRVGIELIQYIQGKAKYDIYQNQLL